MTSEEINSRIVDKHILKGYEWCNGYIFKDPKKGGRWHLYFLNKSTNKSYMIVLKEVDGKYPKKDRSGLNDAERLGIQKISELLRKIYIKEQRINKNIEDLIIDFIENKILPLILPFLPIVFIILWFFSYSSYLNDVYKEKDNSYRQTKYLLVKK